MSLPIQKPALIEHLKRVAEEHLTQQTAGALVITLHWKDGKFQPDVAIDVRLPRWRERST